jgi:hypothetical protein
MPAGTSVAPKAATGEMAARAAARVVEGWRAGAETATAVRTVAEGTEASQAANAEEGRRGERLEAEATAVLPAAATLGVAEMAGGSAAWRAAGKAKVEMEAAATPAHSRPSGRL